MLAACLAMTAAIPAPGNQDAATQVQEGDVEQWIEYYKKERSQSNEPVTDKKALPDSSKPDAGRAEPGAETPPRAPNPPAN